MKPLFRVLPAMFTTAVLPFVSTSSSEGQVKENSTNSKPALVKKVDDSKTAKAPKAELPKLFQPHDFNGNGMIDVPEEAIEFHVDRVPTRFRVTKSNFWVYVKIEKKE